MPNLVNARQLPCFNFANIECINEQRIIIKTFINFIVRSLQFYFQRSTQNNPDHYYYYYSFPDYRFYQSVGSCYKIPRMAYTWSQSFAECQAEGAHLVVVNSQAEHDAVKNFTNTERRVPGARASYFFFAGFRAAKPTGNATAVFKTIFSKLFVQSRA